MASPDTELENTPSYGAMERFLIWFLIPFVFTAVLLGVLLTIFDYDVMNSVLRAANKIPVIRAIVPESKDGAGAQTQAGPSDGAAEGSAQQAETGAAETAAADPNVRLTELEEELKQVRSLLEQRDQTIRELQLENSTLEEKMKSKQLTEDEYTEQIRQLAGMYAKMTPSKAAAIMGHLTQSELVLVLSQMAPDARIKVLERMEPKLAADASIQLKDQSSVRDMEIAALQERLKQMESANQSAEQQKLTQSDLGSTFAAMTPKSAATVLLEMQNTSPDQVISILSSMDTAGRSRIMTAISEQSKETAALISARLVQ